MMQCIDQILCYEVLVSAFQYGRHSVEMMFILSLPQSAIDGEIIQQMGTAIWEEHHMTIDKLVIKDKCWGSE